jgi:serine/threonine-protein kinase
MGEADPLLGRMVGSYRIEKRLGRGGMGAVYAAVQPSIGSTVAIKVLHRKYAEDKAIVERFFNEARAVNLIGHENIVRIFDFGHLEEGMPYFVMELLKGWSLSDLCGSSHPPEEVVPLVIQIARALGAAHAAGVVHRDLKPDNVFIVNTDEGRRVKVLDFGIAKLMTLPGVRHTESGAILGSARYLSPEQAGGEGSKVSPRSDIYSLGVILFELLCGRLPFEATTYGDLLVAQRTQIPPEPRSLVESIPDWLSAVVLRCLAKDPLVRFDSMEALGTALLAGPPPPPVRRRSRLMMPAVGAATIVLLSGGVLWSQTRTAHSTAEATVDAGTTAATVAAVDPIDAGPPPEAPTLPLPIAAAESVPAPKPVARKPPEPRYTIPEKVGDGMIDVDW